MLCALAVVTTSFIMPSSPTGLSSHARASHIHASASAAETLLSNMGLKQSGSAATLPLVSDDTFDDLVLNSEQPIVLDFAADYCGPCKLVEPTLTRLNAKSGISVAKAKLERGSNQGVRDWLGSHGVKITALPTLVLVKDGRPVRSLVGVHQIMKQDVLHDFAFDDVPPPPPLPPSDQQGSPWSFFENLGKRVGLATF